MYATEFTKYKIINCLLFISVVVIGPSTKIIYVSSTFKDKL